MSKSLTTEIKDAVMDTDTYKEGAINVFLPIGGIAVAGTLSNLADKAAFIQKNKSIYNGVMLVVSLVCQFLPKQYLPDWAKKGINGIGIYSALTLLGSLAANPKLPSWAQKAISDYVPGLAGMKGMRGLGNMNGGNIDDMIAAQRAATGSQISNENATTQTALATQTGNPSNLNGFPYLMN